MNVTKNETVNDSVKELMKQAAEILTKLQDAVNTEAVMGSTSMSSQRSSSNNWVDAQSVALKIGSYSWTMTIHQDEYVPSSATGATMPSVASRTMSGFLQN